MAGFAANLCIVFRETGILTMKRAGLSPYSRTHFDHDAHLMVKGVLLVSEFPATD